jgi:hypothetical protein
MNIRKAFLIILCACLLLFGNAFAQTPSPTSEKDWQTSDVLEIKGTLVKMDDTAVSEERVYFIPIGVLKDSSKTTTTIMLTKDGVANPGAMTDANGKFVILVPPDWSRREDYFTVGLNPASIHGPTLPRLDNGTLVIFEVDSQTGKLDMGKIRLKK